VQLTLLQIEQRLEAGLLAKLVKFETVDGKSVVDKMQRLAVNFKDGEVLITFMLGPPLRRFECDLQYFNENLEILYGDTYTGNRTNIRRILEGNQ
jgi:hypothetical protein